LPTSRTHINAHQGTTTIDEAPHAEILEENPIKDGGNLPQAPRALELLGLLFGAINTNFMMDLILLPKIAGGKLVAKSLRLVMATGQCPKTLEH